jgi:hypothetical protein
MIGGIFRIEVRRKTRQSAPVRSQIDERDFLSAALRHLHVRRQVLRHRIGERHFPALHHVREQQRGEDFRDGADLEDRVGVDRLSGLRSLAVRDDATTIRIDDADDDADALVLHVDAIGEDGADVGVGYDRRDGCIGKKQETQNDCDALDHFSSSRRASASICFW